MESAITKSEMIEVLDMYFIPIFQMVGGLLAVIVILLAFAFVIKPFIKRI